MIPAERHPRAIPASQPEPQAYNECTASPGGVKFRSEQDSGEGAQRTPEQGRDVKTRRGCIFIQPCYNQKRAGE